jgi:hypothetical protein
VERRWHYHPHIKTGSVWAIAKRMRFDKRFFEKHQTILLQLARSKWTRWLLGLHKLPKELKDKHLVRITPNSIHWVKKLNKRNKPVLQAAFFTRPRFAEALEYSFSPFAYFAAGWHRAPQFSPIGAIGLLVTLLIPKLGVFGVFGTVTDFYAGSGNGIVGYSNATFSTARNAADGNSVTNNPSTQDNYFQCYLTGGNYIITRAFYPIDTSALTSGAIVSAATMNYYWVSNTNVNSVGNVLVSTSQASNSTLANADYDQIGTTDFGRKAWSSHSSGAMNLIDLNASGIAAISLTGTTKIGIINTRDFDNSAPTGNNYSATRFAAYTGTGSDPYLQVTYTNATIVTPSARSVAAALQTPTLRVDRRFSVSNLSIASAVQAPTVSIKKVVSPNAISVATTLQTPTFTGSRIVSVSQVATSATLQSPTVSGGTGVAVNTLAVTAAVQAPTLVFSWGVFPDVIEVKTDLLNLFTLWNRETLQTASWGSISDPPSDWTQEVM